ncbi:PHD finger protein 12 [Homalodisca vitripennis]|nr:PHD finger protein 12 [Homalodisca vitripennis]
MSSKFAYDLDTSGGSMDEIRTVIASPVRDDGKVKEKEVLDVHSYLKRPDKGYNYDYCDSCKKGGDLLCCDRCPASFLFICYNSSLDDESYRAPAKTIKFKRLEGSTQYVFLKEEATRASSLGACPFSTRVVFYVLNKL